MITQHDNMNIPYTFVGYLAESSYNMKSNTHTHLTARDYLDEPVPER